MTGDQLAKPLRVAGGEIAHDVDAAVQFQIVLQVVFPLGDVFFLRHRLELDHRHVAAALEGAVLVQHIGDAA